MGNWCIKRYIDLGNGGDQVFFFLSFFCNFMRTKGEGQRRKKEFKFEKGLLGGNLKGV